MSRCASPQAKILALLHDTVEDTDVTFETLTAEGFPENLLQTLRLLTHDPSVPYDEYIGAILQDPIAVEVKLADLEDNSDLRRLQDLGPRDVERLQKYLRSYRRLRATQSNSTQPPG